MTNVAKAAKAPKAPTFALIKSEGDIKKALGQFAKTSDAFHKVMNQIVMSAIGHAAQHRNPAVLNEAFGLLKPAYQHALKLYVSVKCPSFLGMEKGKFVVIQGTVTASDAFAKDIEKHYAAEPFFEIKTEGKADPFSNDDVMKRLNAMIKSAEKEGSQVSKDVLATLKDAKASLVKCGVNTVQ